MPTRLPDGPSLLLPKYPSPSPFQARPPLRTPPSIGSRPLISHAHWHRPTGLDGGVCTAPAIPPAKESLPCLSEQAFLCPPRPPSSAMRASEALELAAPPGDGATARPPASAAASLRHPHNPLESGAGGGCGSSWARLTLSYIPPSLVEPSATPAHLINLNSSPTWDPSRGSRPCSPLDSHGAINGWKMHVVRTACTVKGPGTREKSGSKRPLGW